MAFPERPVASHFLFRGQLWQFPGGHELRETRTIALYLEWRPMGLGSNSSLSL